MNNLTHDFGKGKVPAHQHPNGGGWVSDDSHVSDDSYVSNDSQVENNSYVNNSYVNNSHVDNSTVNNSTVNNSIVENNSWVENNSYVSNSTVNNSTVNNSTVENSYVDKTTDILTIGPIGSRNSILTLTRDGHVATGCFHGTFEEFRNAVIKTHGGNIHARNYLAALDFAKQYFENTK